MARYTTYERTQVWLTAMDYKTLRGRRNRLTRDLDTGWVYKHKETHRTQEGDLLMVAWMNAEICRRIDHDREELTGGVQTGDQ